MSVELAAYRQPLRDQLRARRRALPAAERIAGADQLAERLLALPFAPTAGHVAGYWAMDGEIALHAWQLHLPTDCIYCLPVIAGERLAFGPWRPGDSLVSNRYGIPEPALDPASLLAAEDMAFVVLPLVGFDAVGERLGMGGGWYDRAFAFRKSRPAPPWLVGAAYSIQQLDAALDTADWDVALDAVCTESGTHDFREPNHP
ncbi:MAG: 5-formyltetrahydrofolate cyclo-ligase [Lysobacter sp.]